MAAKHFKSRQLEYKGGPNRVPVPEGKLPWKVDWPDYKPVDYTSESVLAGPVWADLDFR